VRIIETNFEGRPIAEWAIDRSGDMIRLYKGELTQLMTGFKYLMPIRELVKVCNGRSGIISKHHR
jgi:hypothetical protein